MSPLFRILNVKGYLAGSVSDLEGDKRAHSLRTVGNPGAPRKNLGSEAALIS